MSNMSLFGWIVLCVIIFIFTVLKIRNEKLSVTKFISLVLLPSVLLGVGSYIISLYSYFFEVESYKFFPSPSIILFPIVYGTIVMLPALIFYAVHTLSLEKRFSPSKWKLFIWAGLFGGVSTLPYFIVAPFEFILIPLITGSLAMLIVYYFSLWRKKGKDYDKN